MINFDIILIILYGVTFSVFALGFLVYINQSREVSNRLFFLLTSSLFLWSIGIILRFKVISYLFVAQRLSFAGGGLSAGLFFWFTYYFPNQNRQRFPRWLVYVVSVLSVCVLTLSLVFPELLIDERIFGGQVISRTTDGFVYYVAFILIIVGAGISNIVYKYRYLTGKEKDQVRFFLVGMILTSVTILMTNLLLPLITNSSDSALFGPINSAIFVAISVYAITRKGLFKLKVVATQGLVMFLLFIIAVRFFLEQDFNAKLFDIGLFVFFMVAGLLLISSVMHEFNQREEVEKLATELQKANNELKALDQMKDELVSIASHELRTPATAIKSYLWMALNKQKDNLNEDLARYIGRAYASSDRLIDLVNDMLSTSRLEGGRIELELGEHDIVLLTQVYIDELQARALERNLSLSLIKPTAPLPLVVVDEEKYAEIIINLVGNSLKYSNEGSITVHFELADKKSPHDVKVGSQSYIWVHVTDTGRGIAKEDIPRLFKKFGKLEKGSFVRAAETGGTGLGLYITKGLVGLHGGQIWIESELGKGSTFSFSVKAAS